MIKLTNPIGWCDETTNAVTGCDKVSTGCKFCYAEAGTRARVLRHRGIETWGPFGIRVPVAEFAPKIRRLNRLAICDRCAETFTIGQAAGALGRCPFCELDRGKLRRIRLFADSNSDWLDEKWPIEVLCNFLYEIHMAPNVDVLLLTKRPQNWRKRVQMVYDHFASLKPANIADLNDHVAFCTNLTRWLGINSDLRRSINGPTERRFAPPRNIWLGVSAENQETADERIPMLLEIPAAIRFVSAEPLLDVLDLTSVGPNSKGASARRGGGCTGEFVCNPLSGEAPYYRESDGEPCIGDCNGLDWVIVGGESGPNRRDCGPQPICDLAADCLAAGVPVYVKQDCALFPGTQGRLGDAVWKLKQFPVVITDDTDDTDDTDKIGIAGS